ncbi:MAG: hypothetical protein JXJ22_15030 [Bacteroidales bacterium]|nr:hypothetical protein [Bacteroidales bacterium]
MHTLSYKIGFWSSVLLTIAFAVWIICFAGIALTSPLFYWTNLIDYLTYVQYYSQGFQNTAKFFMLLFGPLYVLLINSFYDYAADNKKVLARISLLFATAFALLSSLHYFVQLSAVRLSILHGQVNGLEHFVQANPNSIMTAADMLGWTLFLGLSSLFIFPVFTGDKLNRIIRVAFIAIGFSCLLAGIGYVLQIDILTFVFINLGVGGALMTVTIASIALFKRLKKE